MNIKFHCKWIIFHHSILSLLSASLMGLAKSTYTWLFKFSLLFLFLAPENRKKTSETFFFSSVYVFALITPFYIIAELLIFLLLLYFSFGVETIAYCFLAIFPQSVTLETKPKFDKKNLLFSSKYFTISPLIKMTYNVSTKLRQLIVSKRKCY